MGPEKRNRERMKKGQGKAQNEDKYAMKKC